MELKKFNNLFKIFSNNSHKKLAKKVVRFFNPVYVKIYSFFLIFFNLFLWIVAYYINLKIDNDRMALHYNVDFGIDYYDDSQKIYIIPLLGLVIIVVNVFIGLIISNFRDKRFISHILFSAALISNIILMAAIASIYLINFR